MYLKYVQIINQQEIRRRRARKVEAAFAIEGAADGVALFLKSLAKAIGDNAIVFDDKDMAHDRCAFILSKKFAPGSPGRGTRIS